jgi:hypothetical protein
MKNHDRITYSNSQFAGSPRGRSATTDPGAPTREQQVIAADELRCRDVFAQYPFRPYRTGPRRGQQLADARALRGEPA